MRLADFIEANGDAILSEWVEFAATCGPASGVKDEAELRDHAAAMLQDIVADLRTPQSAAEQDVKAKGNAEPSDASKDTAAEVHGAGRAESGFTIVEMVSEYRALRASVIRLWTKACGSLTGDDLGDLMRFNEAIDQSLAEAMTRFTGDVDRSKEMLVAILGHDLRVPLSAIASGAQSMLDKGGLDKHDETVTASITHSAARIDRMIGDLLDFTRSQLGTGIPVSPEPMDLATAAAHAVDEMRSAHPGRLLKLNTSGDVRGSWDAGRIGQLLCNLLGNAMEHGSTTSTISVTVRGETNEAVLQVHNLGVPIPPATMAELFDPFKRLKAGSEARAAYSNIGLGLYIADRVVAAHGGVIQLTSSEDAGTYFTVRLPR